MKKLLPVLITLLFPFFLFAKAGNTALASNAGTMNQNPQTLCEGEITTPSHNGDESLDAGDLLRFILHDGSGTSLGNLVSSQGDLNTEFGFNAQMNVNQIYYLSAIAGEDDGTGNVNLNDPELSVTQGTPITFFDLPFLDITSNNQAITCNNSVILSTSIGFSAYAWSNGDINQSINVINPGTYSVTVTNSNGCTSSDSFTVIEDTTPPTADAGPDVTISCSNSATIGGSNTTPGGLYSWVNTVPGNGFSSTVANPVVSQAGTYCLTVIDLINGCISTPDCVVVTSNSTFPIADAGQSMTLTCDNASVTLDGSNSSAGPNFSYVWVSDLGDVISNAIVTTVNTAGTYTLVVTDNNNGCESSASVVVVADQTPPIADAGPDMILECNNAQVLLDGTASSTGADFTYQWYLNGNAIPGGISLTLLVDTEGLYQLEVLNNFTACSSSDVVEVTLSGAGGVNFSLEDDTYFDCNASEMVLAAINHPDGIDFTFQWTTSDGSILSGGDTPDVTIGTSGTYVLTVENTANSCVRTREIVIYDIDEIISVTPNMTLSCSGGTFIDATTLLPGGNFTYQWATIDGDIASGEGTLSPEITSEGTYELLVTDNDNGCTTSAMVVLGSPTLPTVTITVIGNDFLTCDSTVTLEVNSTTTIVGFYTWTLIGPANPITATTASNIFNVPDTGTFQVIVTDINGCTGIATYTVTGDLDIIESTLPDTLSLNCSNAFTAEIGATLTDPNANASYIWEGENNFFSTDSSITIMEGMEGYYLLGITNVDNGCQDYDTLVVVNDGFTIDVATTLANCDQTDGTATATTALTNTTTMWSTGDQGAMVSNLAQGWYSVTVTDQDNNCDRHTNFFIDEDISCKVVISGYVVNDSNNTCTYDATMEGIECVMVKLDPLGIFTLTDATGYFEFIIDDGSYTVEFIGSAEVELQCPTPGTYDVTLNTNGAISDANHFYVLRKDTDLCITKFSGNARPGLDQFNCVQVCNYGMDTSDAIVTFTHDPIFSDQMPWPVVIPAYGNAYAGDYTYDAATNTFIWDLTDLAPGECRKIMWFMTVPQSAEVGDVLFTEAKVNPIATDINPANNCLAWELQVTGSYDPNDKRNFVGEDQWGGAIYEDDMTMEYAIRFQNVGNDTAFTVEVRDTLDAEDLDVTSIRGFTSSHDMQVQFEDSNVLIFRFENIMLVDSATNEPGSNGWLSFDIDRKPNQPFGTEITNQAAIYFDFNEPVITNEVLNILTEPTSIFSPTENEIPVSVIPTVTKNKIRLNYTLENSSPLSIRLHNTEGVLLQNFDFKNQQSGEHQMELDLEKLSGGVYFLFIKTEEGSAVRRVVKI